MQVEEERDIEMYNENIMKYLNGLHSLEINPNTNWDDYGDIAQYLEYEWKENEEWYDFDMEEKGKGKWVSYQTNVIFLAILPLISSEEATRPYLDFANKVMDSVHAGRRD